MVLQVSRAKSTCAPFIFHKNRSLTLIPCLSASWDGTSKSMVMGTSAVARSASLLSNSSDLHKSAQNKACHSSSRVRMLGRLSPDTRHSFPWDSVTKPRPPSIQFVSLPFKFGRATCSLLINRTEAPRRSNTTALSHIRRSISSPPIPSLTVRRIVGV